jgi:hypothetical protein
MNPDNVPSVPGFPASFLKESVLDPTVNSFYGIAPGHGRILSITLAPAQLPEFLGRPARDLWPSVRRCRGGASPFAISHRQENLTPNQS